MQILNFRTISGPSVYHHRPVIIMELDLEDLAEKASSDSPQFVERLLTTLPGLKEHSCSPGHPGGFIERLQRGTYFAHMIEHISLELSELSGIGVDYGKAVYGGREGIYQVIVRYRSEEGMKFILKEAVQIATKLWASEEVNIQEILEKAGKIIADSALGPSTLALIEAAEKRNIPWKRVTENSLVQLGFGKYRKFIQATTTGETSDISVDIAQDKELTKKLLRECAIRVPYGEVVTTEEELLNAYKKMKTAVAVKPVDGNHGRGVSLDITDEADLITAFLLAQKHSTGVIVEEYFKGHDYRVLLVGGKLIAAAWRRPAHVVGDGVHSIQELINQENENPLRGVGHEKAMTKIEIDEDALVFLNRRHISLEDIPEKGQEVYLRDTANLSTGGTAEDVTGLVHPDIRFMCERAAKIIGLDVCGIDLVLEDISKDPKTQFGGIIEVNAGPGIRMHHYPSKGAAMDVGGAIISHLFRQKSDGRIPIISITGTNGKTTVTRLVSHILHEAGMFVGTTTTDGISIGKNTIEEGDTTGPISARTVLSDPSVEIAVLETARGGIVKRGLGFDWCDVGIITNIQADHIGQDGIETLDDILWVKSLVIERVKEGGTVILNGDSAELMNYVRSHPRLLKGGRKLCLFSMNSFSEDMTEFVERGATALFHKDGYIYQVEDGKMSQLLNVKEIPMTMMGTSVFNIENVMASLLACLSVNVPLEKISDALKSFRSSDNPGRMNLYKINKGYVLLDYGHNPDAFLSIGEMVRNWHMKRVTAVIGAPGDRSDGMISLVGTAASHAFQRIIIREDADKRGRGDGEVASILREAILRECPDIDCTIVHDPVKSFQHALNEMHEKELIIYFYESKDHVMNVLRNYEAVPVDIYALIQPREDMWSSL